MATIISTKTSGVGGLEVTGDATGILQLASNNGTTAVTVDASQNVGIGTASPVNKLQVDSTSATSTTFSRNGGTNANTNVQFKNLSTSFYLGTNSSGNFAIKYNDADLGTSPDLVVDSAGLFKFNSGYGSVATAYGCRAWVNFNGQGTVAIRGSGNVTSITDNGTGQYYVNFTSSMPDTNYAVCATSGNAINSFATGFVAAYPDSISRAGVSKFSTAFQDELYFNVAVFR